MRDYPVDKFMPVVFWPMTAAVRVSSKPLKVCLILLYLPWFVACTPLTAVLLAISIPMAIWDEVNGRW